MATTFTNVVDGNWSTAGNWSAGKPDATVDAIIAANCAIDEAASCKAFTVNTGVTLSGASTLAIAGAITVSTGAIITYTGDVTITPTGTTLCYFGTKSWGNVTFVIGNGVGINPYIEDANTFANLTYTATAGTEGMYAYIDANQTITDTFTVTGNFNCNGRLLIAGARYNKIGPYTINAHAINITGAVDFEGITAAGDSISGGSWDLSGIISGDCGGNTNITFRTPTTVYLACGTNASRQDYNDVWSFSDDGTPDGYDVFPLSQDTVKVTNNSFTGSGDQTFLFHSSGASRCGLDTTEATGTGWTGTKKVAVPTHIYNDVDMSGTGLSLLTGYSLSTINPHKAGILTLNIPSTKVILTGLGYLGSQTGSVRLLSDITCTGDFTNRAGTLDIYGHTLSADTITFYGGGITKTISDSIGGGKLTLTKVTGTLMDASVAGSVISNAPDIQIGDGTKTLTGNVTFMGAGKTYGAVTAKTHAGNFSYIISGNNTFESLTVEPNSVDYPIQLTGANTITGALTLNTPNITNQYSGIKFTAGTTTTVGDFVAVGTTDYNIGITSVTAATHTLSQTSGLIW